MRDYRSQVVVVTGAAGGLGTAFCRRFGHAGATIVALDLHAADLDVLCTRLKGEGIDCREVVCDVSDASAVQQAMAGIIAETGRIDVLINNAGLVHRSAFAATDVAVFERVMAVNFFGALYCTKAVLPQLVRRGGQIIVISSIAGFSPLLGRSGYSASKYALHGLFESLRSEIAPQGVNILMVCPGFTRTGIEKNTLDGAGNRQRRPRSATGRIALPETVAEAVFRAAAANRRLLVLSPIGKFAYWVSRFFPGLYERRMAAALHQEIANVEGEQ